MDRIVKTKDKKLQAPCHSLTAKSKKFCLQKDINSFKRNILTVAFHTSRANHEGPKRSSVVTHIKKQKKKLNRVINGIITPKNNAKT